MNGISRRTFLRLAGLTGFSAAAMTAGCASQPAPSASEGTGGSTTSAVGEAYEPSVDMRKVYVDAAWVKDLIDGKLPESTRYVLLECSWGEEPEATDYTAGHIKGAVHMNTDNVESDENWNYRTPEEFKALFATFGITKDTVVVCYSADVTISADDRVALGFLWAGVENVKCLDGGMKAWKSAGYEVETDSNAPASTDKDFGASIPAHPEYIISIDDVVKRQENNDIHLVSIRSWDEFTGVTSGYSYITRAGEPKGAVWGHDTDDGSYATADGLTAGTDVLEGYLRESDLGLSDQLAFYCGTGWRASIPFLMMYQEGYDNMVLYDGGWFQWQQHLDFPVQVGDPKSPSVVYTTVSELPTDRAKVEIG